MKRLLLYTFLIVITFTSTAQTARTVVKSSTSRKLATEYKVPEVKLNDWRTLDYDTIFLEPNYMFVPLIFDKQQVVQDTIKRPVVKLFTPKAAKLDANDSWLTDAIERTRRIHYVRYRAMIQNPQLVPFNVNKLPEPPKVDVLNSDPTKGKLTINERKMDQPNEKPVDKRKFKMRNWIHSLDASMQFTQAYISDNWYQGGNNFLNILNSNVITINYNQTLHPKVIFNNTIQYRLGIITAHKDSLRNYSLSEDNLQYNSQFGYKAIKNWYYSANLQFKTQLFNNYTANTRNMTASFLSPAELNLGLGMTFSYSNKAGDRTFNMSFSPASYNMKICREIKKLNPASFGIDAGHHTKSTIGSNIEGNFNWKFNPFINWSSRMYCFTNYEYVQGDWENTFNFYVTRHLSTQFYAHLRYDKSHAKNDYWHYWQFKETLSFGLTYRFGD